MKNTLIFSMMLMALPTVHAQTFGADLAEGRMRDFAGDMPVIVQMARCHPSFKDEEKKAFKQFLTSAVGARKVAFIGPPGCSWDTWAILLAQEFGFRVVIGGAGLRPDTSF